MGIGKASNASYALDVSGSARIGTNLDISGNLDVSGTSWLQGNVGIGKASNASYALDVSGIVRIGDLSGVVITRNTTVINPGSTSIITNTNADLGLGVNNAAQFVINRTMDPSGASSFGPVTDASSNLGGPGYRFKNVFASNINAGTSGTLNLGATPTSFRNIALTSALTTVNTNLVPGADDTYDLGTSTLNWNNLYVNNVRSPGNMLLDASAGNGTITIGATQGLKITPGYSSGPIITPSTGTQLLFSADASSHAVYLNTNNFGPNYGNMSLGQGAQYTWQNLFVNKINPTSTTSNILTGTSVMSNVGGSANNNLIFTNSTTNSLITTFSANTLNLGVDSTALVGINADAWYPVTSDVTDLGAASKNWDNLYINNIYKPFTGILALTASTYGSGTYLFTTSPSAAGLSPGMYMVVLVINPANNTDSSTIMSQCSSVFLWDGTNVIGGGTASGFTQIRPAVGSGTTTNSFSLFVSGANVFLGAYYYPMFLTG